MFKSLKYLFPVVTKQKKFDVEDIFSESPKEFSWNQPESVVDISEGKFTDS